MALAVAAALTAVGCRGFTALMKPAAPTFSIDNIHSRISFNLWQIDDWDNESFEVYINDELVFTSPALLSGSSSLVNTPYTGSTQINGDTVVFNMSYATNTGAYGSGGGSGNDQMFDVSIDLPKGFGEKRRRPFVGSTLDGPISDESWALDNLKLLQGFEDAGALDRFGAGLSDEVETASYASLVEYGGDGNRLTAPSLFTAPSVSRATHLVKAAAV